MLPCYPTPHRHSGEDVLGDLKDSGFNFAIGCELHVRRPALALSWINRQSQEDQRFAPLAQPLRGFGCALEKCRGPFRPPT
jgi:hypothetical protein